VTRHLWHILTSNSYVTWEVGRYAGIVLVFCAIKFRQHVLPHLPHRHDSYVSMNGYVHNCTTCGKQPADLERQLAEVRASIAKTPWMGPYMGPDWRSRLHSTDA
jgi:hypothetical protein